MRSDATRPAAPTGAPSLIELEAREHAVAQAEARATESEGLLLQREQATTGRLAAVRTGLEQLKRKLEASGAPAGVRARVPDSPHALRIDHRSAVLAARERLVMDRLATLQERNGVLEASEHQIATAFQTIAMIDAELQAARRHAEAEAKHAQLAAQQVAEGARAPAEVPPPTGRRVAHPAASNPGAERRTMARVPWEARVELDSPTNFFVGFSGDISEGGLFVATWDHTPDIGALVDLRFSLPDGTKVDCRGEVRWQRVLRDDTPDVWPGFGVAFHGLEDGTRTAIHRFVTGREPMFHPD